MLDEPGGAKEGRLLRRTWHTVFMLEIEIWASTYTLLDKWLAGLGVDPCYQSLVCFNFIEVLVWQFYPGIVWTVQGCGSRLLPEVAIYCGPSLAKSSVYICGVLHR